MIEFHGVTKKFGSTNVLNDLTIHVKRGSTVALLGLSGSGKTTALKLVCGLHFPDTGTVSINGTPLTRDILPELRKDIGYVIQDGGLFPHLTVYQNLALVGREAQIPDEAIRSRVNELADMTKISKSTMTRYPREISGGQRQRVGIMRALFLNPSMLLLDEPFGALDPITRSSLQEDLRALCREMGKTVLMVTHDIYEAGYMADTILLLNQGRIAQAGSLRDLMLNPANEFVQLFTNSQRHIGIEA
ncbi:MAG: ATP-binding cassette domain-containing protein [Bdellovibrionales bacterium]|jgi:osmoprotectant transport system ATP-binding protein|nr:ATP-binding cassette domain-containing protein [Bdellovibrionales bacterium]